jgi:hypothetical protein
VLADAGPALGRLGDRDSDRGGDNPHRFRELHPFVLGDEREHIAAFATPKTLEELTLGVDGERGGLLVVEGTKGFIAPAGLFQLDVSGDDLHNVGGTFDLSHCGFRDTPCQSTLFPRCLAAPAAATLPAIRPRRRQQQSAHPFQTASV